MSSVDDMIRLGKLALLFGRTDRATFHEDGVTPESDTDHTVMLGFIACTVGRELDGFCTGRIAELVLVHDIVEAYANDTNTFDISEDERAAKKEREKAAYHRLREEFFDDSWLINTLVSYEEQEEPEARLIRYLDKATPKINHFLNHCAGIKAMGKTKDDMVRAHRKQFDELSIEYPDISGLVGNLLVNIMLLSEDAWNGDRHESS